MSILHNWKSGGSGSAPLPSPTIFTGKAMGGFSSSNTAISSAGNYVQWGPGTTLCLVYQKVADTANTQTILNAYNGASSTLGWQIDIGASPVNHLAITVNSSFIQPSFALPLGVTTLVMPWTSGGVIQYSMNGAPLQNGGTVPAPTLNASTISVIGSPSGALAGGRNPLADRLLAFSVLPTALTSSQAQAIGYTAGNRFTLPSAATSGALVDFSCTRDYTGGSSIVTLGSAPVTYTVGGSLSLVACDEYRWGPLDAFYNDGKLDLTATDGNGIAYAVRDTMGSYYAVTDSPFIMAEAYSSNTAQPSMTQIGAYLNGAWSSEQLLGGVNIPQTLNFALGSKKSKVVNLWEGPCAMSGTAPPYTRGGTGLLGIRLPVNLFDGTTSSRSAMMAPPTPMKTCVVVADSIYSGWSSSVFTQTGFPAVARAHYPGRMVFHSAGSESMENIYSQLAAHVAAIVAALAGAAYPELVFALGTNDYSNARITPSTFGTYMAALLDALKAAVPTLRALLVTPIPRISPASESANGLGSTLTNYRSQFTTVASTRSSWCTVIDGTTIITADAGHYAGDGVHPDDAGIVQIESGVRTGGGW